MPNSEIPPTISFEEQQLHSSKPSRSHLYICLTLRWYKIPKINTSHPWQSCFNPSLTPVASVSSRKEEEKIQSSRAERSEGKLKRKGRELPSLSPLKLYAASPNIYIQDTSSAPSRSLSPPSKHTDLPLSEILEHISSTSKSSHNILLCCPSF